jgi:2,3-bisphosphoglycerate-independent phosphoglycerate mutase
MSTQGITDRVLLVICDGLGYSDNTEKNAVRDAKTPNLDEIWSQYPFTTIHPGGVYVGLPKGVAGNSEVGHMNLGAGRPVRQDLVRINEAIQENTLKDQEKLVELLSNVKKGGRLHLMGLLSDGGVHSHIDHLKALANIFANEGIDFYFHAYMDGRDTPKTNGVNYLKELSSISNLTLASMQGRSIGMDRDRRWEKIERAFNMMTGKDGAVEDEPSNYIQEQYHKDLYDEFIEPALFSEDAAIKDGDHLFFINFRPDRARQISQAFVDKNFPHFDKSLNLASFFMHDSLYR